jgi:ribonuclease D
MRTAPPSPDLSELPLLRYGGEIVLVDRPELLNEVVPLLLAEPYLGFDTETRPAFKKGEKYAPALVQLASSHRVYLLQLRELGITDALVTLLEQPLPLKVGIAIRDDIKALQEVRPFVPSGLVDLGDLARRQGIEQRGARSLAARFLGGRVSKGAQTSNWAVRTLSEKQKIYAATDAWICLKLYPLLSKSATA